MRSTWTAWQSAVILSTCNRVEVYADVPTYHAGFLALKRLLTETRGVRSDELSEPLYAHWEQDAADHLFSVAAGLDSMVLGETQIHAQVREAMRRAEAEGAAGPALGGLFRAAVRCGPPRSARNRRWARRRTPSWRSPPTSRPRARVASEVVTWWSWVPDRWRRSPCSTFAARGAGPVRILNRSLAHARALAERTNAEHGDLDALPAAMSHADVVVSATGAAGIVVHARRGRPAPCSTDPLAH